MRCATIGCQGAPVAVMVWPADPELGNLYPDEPVCEPCRYGYAHRPRLMAQGVTFRALPVHTARPCRGCAS